MVHKEPSTSTLNYEGESKPSSCQPWKQQKKKLVLANICTMGLGTAATRTSDALEMPAPSFGVALSYFLSSLALWINDTIRGLCLPGLPLGFERRARGITLPSRMEVTHNFFSSALLLIFLWRHAIWLMLPGDLPKRAAVIHSHHDFSTPTKETDTAGAILCHHPAWVYMSHNHHLQLWFPIPSSGSTHFLIIGQEGMPWSLIFLACPQK